MVRTRSTGCLMKSERINSAQAGVPPGRAEPKTILLAEDTPTLRQLYTHYLLDAGYRVLQAHDGDIAQIIVKSGAEIDLLVTDYHMPQLNGVDLSLWFHARHPDVPVLLISATLEHVEIAADVLPFALCRMKPPLYEEFVRLVERALDHRPPPPEP